MKSKLSRRQILSLCGKSALLIPGLLAIKGLGSGCTAEKYDVEIEFKAQRSGSVLELTSEQLSGINYNLNNFTADGRDKQAMFVYSIQNMWGDWIFEVNGNRIYSNVGDYVVNSGDVVIWKGNFSK